MDDTAELLKALARAKVEFQQRTIAAVILGAPLPIEPEVEPEQLRRTGPP